MSKHPRPITSEPVADEALAKELALASTDPTTLPAMDELYQELRSRIDEDERGVGGFLRSRSNLTRHLIAVGAVLAPVLLVWRGMLRPDGAGYPADRMLLILATLALLLGVTLLMGLRPLQLPLLSRRTVGVTVAGSLAATAALYLLPEVSSGLAGAEARSQGLGALLTHAMGCSMWGLMLAGPVYLLLRLMDRGDNPYGPVMAVAAGLCANMVLQLHCPVTQRAHMLLGHLGVIVVLLLVHRLTRPGSRPSRA